MCKAHKVPTPYLGGVAIACGTLLPATLLPATGGSPRWTASLGILVSAGVVLAVLGLVDDLANLSSGLRLLVEGVAAAGVVASGCRAEIFGNWLDPAMTTIWIVVLTNSFNLLDNMDGAAASIGSVTAAILGASALVGDQLAAAVLLWCLAASCVGFGAHNWAPARIFMGDAGSLFIGFVIACSTVLVHDPGQGAATLTAMVLMTFVGTLDTAVVLVSRRRAGRRLMVGGTDHVSHRLLRLGLTVPQVAAALAAAAAAAGVLGVLVGHGRLPVMGTFLGTAAIGLVLGWLLLKVPGYVMPPAGTPALGTAALAALRRSTAAQPHLSGLRPASTTPPGGLEVS